MPFDLSGTFNVLEQNPFDSRNRIVDLDTFDTTYLFEGLITYQTGTSSVNNKPPGLYVYKATSGWELIQSGGGGETNSQIGINTSDISEIYNLINSFTNITNYSVGLASSDIYDGSNLVPTGNSIYDYLNSILGTASSVSISEAQKWNGNIVDSVDIDQIVEETLHVKSAGLIQVNANVATVDGSNNPTITSKGDANTNQVVGGWDTRLTDARKWDGTIADGIDIDQIVEETLHVKSAGLIQVNANVTTVDGNNNPTITSKGDANTNQVVGGWDTRLTDARKWNGTIADGIDIDQIVEETLHVKSAGLIQVNANVATVDGSNNPTITSKGDANTNQVVGGWDTRLTDARKWNGILDSSITQATARSAIGAGTSSQVVDVSTFENSSDFKINSLILGTESTTSHMTDIRTCLTLQNTTSDVSGLAPGAGVGIRFQTPRGYSGQTSQTTIGELQYYWKSGVPGAGQYGGVRLTAADDNAIVNLLDIYQIAPTSTLTDSTNAAAQMFVGGLDSNGNAQGIVHCSNIVSESYKVLGDSINFISQTTSKLFQWDETNQIQGASPTATYSSSATFTQLSSVNVNKCWINKAVIGTATEQANSGLQDEQSQYSEAGGANDSSNDFILWQGHHVLGNQTRLQCYGNSSSYILASGGVRIKINDAQIQNASSISDGITTLSGGAFSNLVSINGTNFNDIISGTLTQDFNAGNLTVSGYINSSGNIIATNKKKLMVQDENNVRRGQWNSENTGSYLYLYGSDENTHTIMMNGASGQIELNKVYSKSLGQRNATYPYCVGRKSDIPGLSGDSLIFQLFGTNGSSNSITLSCKDGISLVNYLIIAKYENSFRLRLHSNGNLTISGNYSPSSDDRLKHNEEDISNGLETINKLNPITYYKTRQFYEHNKIFASDEIPSDATFESGFIAQEVRNIPELSHLVSGEEYDSSDGEPTSLYLNYTGIQPYICKAIQELNTIVQNQQATIEQLTSLVQTQQKQIDDILSRSE